MQDEHTDEVTDSEIERACVVEGLADLIKLERKLVRSMSGGRAVPVREVYNEVCGNRHILQFYALALIDRQTTEIKRLEAEVASLRKQIG
jgi:hypothetical protein